MALDLPALGFDDEDVAAFRYMMEGVHTGSPIVLLNKCLKLGFETIKARDICLAKEAGEPLDESTLPQYAPVLRRVAAHDNVTEMTRRPRIAEKRPNIEVHVRTLAKTG